jgi:hypothetical protein
MDIRKLAVVPVLALVFGACSEIATEPMDAQFSTLYGETEREITPDSYDGNFVSSDDDQVCYDMAELGYIGGWNAEMRGFKIDPPVAYNDGNVATTLMNGGKTLNWTTTPGTQILAFIIKGGPKYNVYDYVANVGVPPFDWTTAEYDNGLVSPLHRGKTPAISHYNVCYYPDPGDDQGCTPGYWRNHADRWVGVAPTADFDGTFGVDLFDPNITLGVAIWLGGGGNNAFARHATAALLNAYAKADGSLGQFVNYPYTVAEVIQMVQDAVANGTIEATKDLFETANELGCPLSGTPAVPVS